MSLDLGFVRVELVGPGERYAVTAAGKADVAGNLKRDAGTHRLSVEFDRDRLAVFVDDLVLWVRDAGPGELRSIKLVSDGDGTEAAAIDDVLVANSEPPAEPRPWADLTADAVRSPDGDETFGTLTAAGPAGVTLEMKGKKLAIGWPAAAEFAFRRGPVTEAATSGEHVRVRLKTAEGLHDVLDGAVKAFDDKALTLVHPVLGELTLPRDRVEEVRLLFHGRRVPVDAAAHHLGARPAFGFAVPKPEGLRLVKTVALANPAAGFVVIDAAQVSATGTPVEVLVNGERVGELNRLAGRAEPMVRAYRVPVVAGAWRRGDNEIEVRLRPAASGKVTGIDVRAVRLELDDPRDTQNWLRMTSTARVRTAAAPARNTPAVTATFALRTATDPVSAISLRRTASLPRLCGTGSLWPHCSQYPTASSKSCSDPHSRHLTSVMGLRPGRAGPSGVAGVQEMCATRASV